MNLAELASPQPQPGFGRFASDTVAGLLEGYTNDTVAFVFLTGVAFTVFDNKRLQRVGRGLMAYGTLMQASDYVGFIGSSLRFIGGVIRDNPYFLEKHRQQQVSENNE
jgi:hypothetical protein